MRDAMMLAGKAWRESRARFLIAVGVVGGLSALLVLCHEIFRARAGRPMGFAEHVELRLYATVVRALFLVLAALLGLGGLRREREVGTIGFTLALPVPGRAHLAARAAVGLGELLVLAWLPALVVPLCAIVVGERFPFGHAAAYALFWTLGGALVHSAALVASVLLGSWAALTVSLVAVEAPALLGLPLRAFMMGRLSWGAAIVVASATLALVAAAARVPKAAR